MKKSILTPFEWSLIAGTFAVPVILALSVDTSVFGTWQWWLTFTASMLNICCCVCSAKGNSMTFFFGALFNTLYTFYCIKTGYYGNAAVYGGFFLPMQLVGWLRWRKIGNVEGSDQVAAKRLTPKQRLILSAAVLAGLGILLFVLNLLGGRNIVVDAVCTVLCVVAQTMLTLAYFEQWFIWIGVNLATIILWVMSCFENPGIPNLSDLNFSICYFFVMFSSVNGLRIWLRLSRRADK